MKKKHILILIIGLVLGVIVVLMSYTPQPVHAFHEALVVRNTQLGFEQFERAVNTFEDLDSQIIVMDALLNKQMIDWGKSEILKGYMGGNQSPQPYHVVAGIVIMQHREIFVPALIRRLREVASETGEIKVKGEMVWALPNGEVILETLPELISLVGRMSESEMKIHNSHHGVQITMKASNGKVWLFDQQHKSMGCSFGPVEPDVLGMGGNPKPFDTSKSIKEQMRIVVVNKQNIDEVLDAIEAAAEKYFAKKRAESEVKEKGNEDAGRSVGN